MKRALVFAGVALMGVALTPACGSSGAGTHWALNDAGHDGTVVDTGALSSGDAGTCKPLTCATLGFGCGLAGDGCGGTVDCGSCKSPETCGGGGKFSQCGGVGACVSKTCTDLGANCGPQGDGCGNLIQCGTCTSPDICGGGGSPSVCGTNGPPHPDGGLDGGACIPHDCASQGIECGPAGDGCGNLIQCGGCGDAGQACGGGGVNGKCGSSAASCTPTTCTKLGYDCGPAADGCGGLLQCGTCSGKQICGGGSKPSVCGNTCTGLCLDQTTCDGGATTSISGRVVAGTLSGYLPSGGSPDPVPNVLVYVPNGTPTAFTKGVECSACGADVTGDPLVEATTDYEGNFTLTNVPVPPSGTSLPLVIQLGRWRRIFGLGNSANPGFSVTACQQTDIGSVRMPRNQGEGDIPLTAISTGRIDPMECVLLKMGVDQAEFTNPGGGGRVEIYKGNGSFISPSSPAETALVPDKANDTATLDQYDQVIFPCWGEDPIATPSYRKTQNQQQNVVSYANAGGRMFATHLSYSWLYFTTDSPFNETATWVGDPAGGDPDLEYDTGTASITHPSTSSDVNTFYDWMNALTWNGASSGQFSIIDERNNFSAIGAGSVLWASVTNAAPTVTSGSTTYPTHFPVVYTFDTPYSTSPSPPAQCGKVIYSDFHVSVINGGGYDGNDAFPSECTSAQMSAQEKALEYLIWDLASCLTPPKTISCTPRNCSAQGIGCGPAGDGCGNAIDCGACPSGQTCGGGGTPSQCGGLTCKPESCVDQKIDCGPAGDGCGNAVDCGACAAGLSCGGGGINGKCGSIDAGPTCTPETCADQNIECGPAGDGCGNQIDCGSCPAGEQCGAGGSGICGPVCSPKTCTQLGYDCGPAPDGCGHELQCGTCTLPQTCGGGGKPSVCGGNSTSSK